jgi:hypothetical protein
MEDRGVAIGDCQILTNALGGEFLGAIDSPGSFCGREAESCVFAGPCDEFGSRELRSKDGSVTEATIHRDHENSWVRATLVEFTAEVMNHPDGCCREVLGLDDLSILLPVLVGRSLPGPFHPGGFGESNGEGAWRDQRLRLSRDDDCRMKESLAPVKIRVKRRGERVTKPSGVGNPSPRLSDLCVVHGDHQRSLRYEPEVTVENRSEELIRIPRASRK